MPTDRQDLMRELATTLDLPPEILDMGTVDHWDHWLTLIGPEALSPTAQTMLEQVMTSQDTSKPRQAPPTSQSVPSPPMPGPSDESRHATATPGLDQAD